MAAVHPPITVVKRIADELRQHIQLQLLSPGARLPSVRALARERKVSAFTAAEIYNTLVAAGVLVARPGRGYFVAARKRANGGPALRDFPVDSLWERRREASGQPISVDAGCGWLPTDWLYMDGVRRALRSVARDVNVSGGAYGNPYGLAELRQHLALQAQDKGIETSEDQWLLTHGASQALHLVVSYGVSRGDAVVVEDPGYPPLFDMLRARGARLLTVPRTRVGPDVEALARILKRNRPKFLFTNTTFQNPTGTTTSAATAQRLLELANRHDFTIVEDDIFAEMATHPVQTVAGLDGFRRVIYISSFSKTIAPDLRVGYMVAPRSVARKLVQLKVMTSLASSQLLEQAVLQVLTQSHYRRHLDGLRRRLVEARLTVGQAFKARGVETAFDSEASMFLWAKLPSKDTLGKMWRTALAAGVLLAPGELFRPDGQATNYWRFNVAYCNDARLYEWLESL